MTDPVWGEQPTGEGGPHVFVEDIDRPEMSEVDEHHVTRVLRLSAGAALTICDGKGSWRTARLRGGNGIEPDGPVITVAPRAEELTLGFALVKGERPELVVQKATEVGIDVIVPFVAERSVVRWDQSRAARNGQRLTRVAREAAMQSRRCRLPVVSPVTAFSELASVPGAAGAERGAAPLTLSTTTLLIGPEGGWSEGERSLLAVRVGLGAHVLRAETAAITGAALLAGLHAGLVAPATGRSQRDP